MKNNKLPLFFKENKVSIIVTAIITAVMFIISAAIDSAIDDRINLLLDGKLKIIKQDIDNMHQDIEINTKSIVKKFSKSIKTLNQDTKLLLKETTSEIKNKFQIIVDQASVQINTGNKLVHQYKNASKSCNMVANLDILSSEIINQISLQLETIDKNKLIYQKIEQDNSFIKQKCEENYYFPKEIRR